MSMRHIVVARAAASASAALVAGSSRCVRRLRRRSEPATAAAGPPTIDVVRVVEQPLDVTLSMPGELDPYETVAIYPKVTGFVKTIRVDRGSRVRAGDLLAELEAPELVAQRAEAQSKLQAPRRSWRSPARKPMRDASTYDKLKAASATPGVVAGNDVVLAQKAVEADQSQIAAAQQTVEAARQALQVGHATWKATCG